MSEAHSVRKCRYAAPCAALILAVWLASCQAPPREETARDVINAHYGARGYRVMELDIGDIRPVSLGEKTYMGTPGYEIEVRAMTVEGDRTGRLSFSDARVRIREARESRRGWVVIGVTGIPLP